MADITLTPPVLPEGFCPGSEQERANTYFALAQALLSESFAGGVRGSSQPSVDDQDKFWVKTNSDGSLEGIYTFSGGAWVRPHSIPASSKIRLLWTGTPTQLETYDGGSAVAVSDNTGPFWEIDTDWENRVPIGVGSIAALNTNEDRIDNSSPSDKVRGIYFIKRTARANYVG